MITTTKNLNNGKKSSGNIMLRQSKSMLAHQSIFKPNKKRRQNSQLKKHEKSKLGPREDLRKFLSKNYKQGQQEKSKLGPREDLPKFLSKNYKQGLHGEYRQSKKRPRAITTTKNSSDGKRSSGNTMLRQDKPIPAHQRVLKSNKRSYEEEESAKEVS